jgi:hypothetical protein
MIDRTLKQFFTHDYDLLLPILVSYPIRERLVIDPFAGEQHLLRLVDCDKIAVDVDASVNPDIVADSFNELPKFESCAVITNPPYAHWHILQRENQRLAEAVMLAGYVDLYEYSIRRVIDQLGFCPIYAILPENFIASRTTRLRRELYKHIKVVQIHTRSLCDDTEQPTVFVVLTPEEIDDTDLWIDDKFTAKILITADGLQPRLEAIGDYVDFGMKPWQTEEQRNTSILLKATDGGSENNRIRLMTVAEQFPGLRHFHNKISDRAYIQIVPKIELSDSQIELLKMAFNRWVDKWRSDTFGLGLTSFRNNSNGFRRKRLDFKLARLVLNNLIDKLLPHR